MMRLRLIVSCLVGAFALIAQADTVYYNPDSAGGTKEVTTVISGTDDVAVNDPAQGAVGFVRLSGANTYTGATLLPTGTLEVTSLAASGTASSIGSSGALQMGSAIFHYTGSAPAVFDRDFVSTLSANKAVRVFQLDGDVTFKGAMDLGILGFAKLGQGDFIYDPGNSSTEIKNTAAECGWDSDNNLVLPADGSSPTTGFAPFMLGEGRFIMKSGKLTVKQDNSSGSCFKIGNGASDGNFDHNPVFWVQGGTVSAADGVLVGCGLVGTDNNYAEPVLRITGGSFSQGGGKWMNTNHGCTKSKARIEVLGGTFNVGWSYLQLNEGCSDALSSTTLVVSNATVSISQASLHTYNRNNSTSDVQVLKGGSIILSGDRSDIVYAKINSSNKGYTQFTVKDGGILQLERLTVCGGKMVVDVDGGVLATAIDSGVDYPASSYLEPIRLGAGGATINVKTSGATRQYNTAFVTRPGLATDGGLVISNAYATSTVSLGAANSYAGPTLVAKGRLALAVANALPSTTVLTLNPSTALELTGAETVAGLVLGDKATIDFGADGSLTASALTVNGTTLYVDAEAVGERAAFIVPTTEKAKLANLSVVPASGCAYSVTKVRTVDSGDQTTVYLTFGATADITFDAAIDGFGLRIGDGAYVLTSPTITAAGHGTYTIGTYTKGDESQLSRFNDDSLLTGFKNTFTETEGEGGVWTIKVTTSEVTDDCYWTGTGGTAKWENAANWQHGWIPGIFKKASGSVYSNLFAAANFGPVADGAVTTIDTLNLTSVSNFIIKAGAPAYQFSLYYDYNVGTEQAQRFNIYGQKAKLEMEAGVTTTQTFNSRVYFNPASSQQESDRQCVINNGSGLLYFKNGRCNGYNNWIYFQGTGDMRFDRMISGDTAMSRNYCQGTITAYNTTDGNFKNFYAQKGSSSAGVSLIALPLANTGIIYSDWGDVEFCKDLVGDNSVKFTGDGYVASYNSKRNADAKVAESTGGCGFSVRSGYTAEMDCDVRPYRVNETHNTLTFAFVKGGGALKLNKTTTYINNHDVQYWGILGSDNTTLSLTKIGDIGCTDAESNIGGEPKEIRFTVNGTLEYRGTGESFDRTLGIVAAKTATVKNSGTGTLTFDGAVTQSVASAALKLNADTAPIVYAGTVGSEFTLPVTITGENTVQLQNCTRISAIKLVSGNLLATDGLIGLTVASGENTVTVPENMQLTLPSVTVSGGTVNFIVPDSSSVTITSHSGTIPTGIMVNGHGATWDENGKLVELYASWKTAVDGNWDDATKWSPANVPPANATVDIAAEGESYTVTAGTIANMPAQLIVSNAAANATATVDFTAGVSFSNTLVTATESGKIRVSGGDVCMPTTTSSFKLNGGTLELAEGAGRLYAPETWTFGSGETIFDSTTAAFAIKYLNIKPDAAGETATMTIKTRTASMTSANGGITIGGVAGASAILNLEDTAATASQLYLSGYYNFLVGYENGYGELNLSGGYIRPGNNGFQIGALSKSAEPYADALAPTGIVNIAGGKFEGSGWGASYISCPCGIIIGDGLFPKTAGSDAKAYGRVNLSGGTVAPNGDFMLGAGQARGEFVQTGGSFEHTVCHVNNENYKNQWGSRNYYFPVVIGFGYGDGEYTMNGGSFKAGNPVFIGGATTNAIPWGAERNAAWAWAKTGMDTASAKGKFVHRNGSVEIDSGSGYPNAGNLYVGVDGEGTLDIGSDGGFLVEGDLVLSNQVKSALILRTGDNGSTALTVNGALVITDGAELTVDFSAAESLANWVKVAAVGSFEGAFAADKVTFVKAAGDENLDYVLHYEHDGVAGLWVERLAPIGVFPLQWNSSYATGVPYEMAVDPAKLTALGGIEAGKTYKLTATTADGTVDVPFTLIVDKVSRDAGDRSANTVTLRFTPPAGTTALKLEQGEGEMTVVQSDAVDNFYANVLESTTGWSTDGNCGCEVTSTGLVIKVTTASGVNLTASYEKVVPEELRGRSASFEIDVRNIGKHAFGNPIYIYQYDANGALLPETVFDRRYTTQFRPVGKLMRLRAKGRIHPEAAKLRLTVIMRSHGRSYDEAGMPMTMTVEDASKLLVSRLALRAEDELPFPPMDNTYFAKGVSATGDDKAFVLTDKRGFCYNVNSQAVWADGTQVRGESDRFFPGASSEGGTVEAWVKPDWTGRSTVYLFSGHLNFANGTMYTFIQLTYKPSDNSLALTMRDRNATHTYSGKATQEITGGVWHHLALAWKPGETADVYLDGTSVLSVALADFLIMDTTASKWADTWVEEFVFGTEANSIRNSTGDRTTRFVGYLDNLRASTGRRYTENFTPATSFTVDADTRALFTFDMSIDGIGSGGLQWVEGSVDSDCSLYTFTPTGASGAYYTGTPRADIDYDNNIQLNNYPVMPTAKQLRATRVEKREVFTLRRGVATEFSIDAANVYPDFIEVKNPSATETLEYPIVLNAGEHDPRSWADLKETLFNPNTNDVGNAERVFQYIIKAGDYMGDYCVDYAAGTENKQQATYLSLAMLNAYAGFECGPQNNLTCNTLVQVGEVGAGMTPGYAHSFQHAHYDGETHLYDMSTTLRAFPPDWTGEKVFSLIDADREPGMFKHFHGEVGYHFLKMSTRGSGNADSIVVSAKYGPVLNPGESFRVYWRNNGQFNDYRYDSNVLKRRRRQFPDYGNGFILYRGAPNVSAPSLTDNGSYFTYKIAIQYPFVAGRYRAIKAGDQDAAISYSFDRGTTWTEYTPGSLLELPVKGRHEMLLKVAATVAEIEELDFATEVLVNSRTFPGRMKAGDNQFTLKTESGETAQVVFGWSEDAAESIVIDGIFERGDRPGDETAVAFVNPDEGAKELAISGVSGEATTKVIKLPIDRTTGERLTAAIAGGKLVLTAVNYSGPFIEGVKITDGDKVKYLTVICESGIRVADSSMFTRYAGTVTEGTDTAKSVLAYKHIAKGGYMDLTLPTALAAGNYMALYFDRRGGWADNAQLNQILPTEMATTTSGARHYLNHQNSTYDYWETKSGESGGRSRWRWSMMMYDNGDPSVYAVPENTTSMRYVVYNGTNGVDLAAVAFLPATDDAEFKDQLVRNLTGYNTNPWAVDETAEYAEPEEEDTTAIYVSASGSDSDSGTLCHPFATLEKAFASVTSNNTPIVVKKGTLKLSSAPVFNLGYSGVVLKGQTDDAADSVIDGKGLYRCLEVQQSLTVRNLTLKNGYANDGKGGAGIYQSGDMVLNVTNCVVDNCHSERTATADGTYLDGGGVYMGNNRRGDVVDLTVRNCSATIDGAYKGYVRGGGVFMYKVGGTSPFGMVRNVWIEHCAVTNRTNPSKHDESSTYGGGAHLLGTSGSPTIACNWVVTNCSVYAAACTSCFPGNGGGLSLDVATVTNSLIAGCDSGCFGGGVHISNSGRLVGSTVRGNTINLQKTHGRYQPGGAGVSVYGTAALIDGCLIEDNRVTGWKLDDGSGTIKEYNAQGGGINVYDRSAGTKILNSVIRGNYATSGGGFRTTGMERGLVSNCLFQANGVVRNNNEGAAMFSLQSARSIEFVDVNFYANTNYVSGLSTSNWHLGSVGGQSGCYSNIVFRNCAFTKNYINTSRYYGWLVYVDLASNGAVAGAKPFTFDHCTFANNYNAAWAGDTVATYAIYRNNATDLFKITGCVGYNNRAQNYNNPTSYDLVPNNQSWADEGVVTYTYSQQADNLAITDGQNGNLTNASVSDPKFADAANGDYRLTEGSPLVNAGGPFAEWMGPCSAKSKVRDMGEPVWTCDPVGDYGVKINRGVTNPRATGTASDMGAYELYYVPGTVIMLVSDSSEPDVTRVAISNSWVETYVPDGKSINDKPENGNGYAYWKSYVLGLKPTEKFSKPIIKGVQNADPNKLAFKLGNVTYNVSSAVYVTYKVRASDTVNGVYTDVSEAVDADEDATVALPGTLVKYYRVFISYSS